MEYYSGTKILYDYPSTTPRQRGWGNPDSPGFSKHMRRVICPGIPLYVHWIVRPFFEGLIYDLHQAHYHVSSSGGYNNRDIRGRPGVKSNHAWGLAADFNAGTNPMTEDGKVHTDIPHAHHFALKWYLFWGGDYSGSRKDPMHFECILSKRQALRLRRKAKVRLRQMQAEAKTPRHRAMKTAARRNTETRMEVSMPALKVGDTGGYVGILQCLLKFVHGFSTIKRDYDFGKKTEAAIKVFQEKHHLSNTGVVNDTTWQLILTPPSK